MINERAVISAFVLFAAGIIGTGLLAVPVLAESAAYAVSEMFGWAGSLDARPNDARAFYATIAVATLLGATLSLVGLDPVRALYTGPRWSTGCSQPRPAARPAKTVMMLIVRNPRVMGRLTLSRSMAIWEIDLGARAKCKAAKAVPFGLELPPRLLWKLPGELCLHRFDADRHGKVLQGGSRHGWMGQAPIRVKRGARSVSLRVANPMPLDVQ